jgi:hypothetical protein
MLGPWSGIESGPGACRAAHSVPGRLSVNRLAMTSGGEPSAQTEDLHWDVPLNRYYPCSPFVEEVLIERANVTPGKDTAATAESKGYRH